MINLKQLLSEATIEKYARLLNSFGSIELHDMRKWADKDMSDIDTDDLDPMTDVEVLQYIDLKYPGGLLGWNKNFKHAMTLNENSEFRGEYWIQDGHLQFADSAVDMGHEAYAIQQAGYELLSDLDIMKDEPYLPDMDDEIYEKLEPHLPENIKEHYNNNDISMPELLIWYGVNILKKQESDFKELVLTAYDISSGMDPRTYAMKRYNWKALRGTEVNTWTLTPQDLNSIANGIYEAYESELKNYDQTHKDIDEHGHTGPYFSIEVFSRKDYYSEVPYSLIDSGNISEIQKYKTLHKGERIFENKGKNIFKLKEIDFN